jgi:hypothetical protein
VPYLPLVAARWLRLAAITQAMQFTLANSTTTCQMGPDGTSAGEKLVPIGRQTVGHRFMIGITSLADAARYQLDTAALQTQVSADAANRFTSSAGRTFVAPTQTSMRAATKLLTADPASGTWPIPYDRLRTDPAGAGAYPGTMVVYASVPTTGMPASDAKDYASLIRFAAGTGQTPGAGNGQLPPGYLPMTKANGLAALASYAGQVATGVQAQRGATPTNLAGTPSGSGGAPASTPATTPSPGPTTTPGKAGTPTGTLGQPAVQRVSLGTTTSVSPGAVGIVLPALLLLAVGGGLLVPVSGLYGRIRGRR